MNTRLSSLPSWPTLLLLFVTAVSLTRVMFWFFDDPEGPNLLIVMVMGGAVYVVSLGVYVLNIPNAAKIWLTLFAQICLVLTLFACLQIG